MKTLQKMTDNDIKQFARKHLDKWGFPGWDIAITNTPKNQLGHCNHAAQKIVLNQHFIKNGLNSATIKDTILHEIAHAFDVSPRFTNTGRRLIHDKVWRRWAIMVGADPAACGNADGYIPPVISNKKWTLVYIDETNQVTKIETYGRFLKNLKFRALRNRPLTFGNLWLVLSDKWDDYRNDKMALCDLQFWQNNPNANNRFMDVKLPCAKIIKN